jgi:hypothetical protein
MKKYMGDDQYSWAIFKDGKPYVTGESRTQASYLLKKFRKEESIIKK